MKRNESMWGYLMISPLLAGLFLFAFWPMIQSFYLSFTTWKGFGTYEWTGLANYQKLLKDPEILRVLRNTAVFTFGAVPVSIVTSLIAAVLLNRNIRGKNVFRTLYFLPTVTMPAVIAMIWKWLLNGDYGLLNQLLRLVGLSGVSWLTDPNIAWLTVIGVASWAVLGHHMIILLAGLQGIPAVYHEAAAIDGATPARQFFAITLPLLSPTLFFLTVTTFISMLQMFEYVFILIGPTNIALDTTKTIVYLFYEISFVFNEKGYGSTVVILLFVIIVALTWLQFRLQKKWVHYE